MAALGFRHDVLSTIVPMPPPRPPTGPLNSIAGRLSRDFRRQIWLAASALVLTVAALGAALVDLDMDRGAERHYRDAIDRAQRIFAAERFVSELRSWEGAALRAVDRPAGQAGDVDIDLPAVVGLARALRYSSAGTGVLAGDARMAALGRRVEAAARDIESAAVAASPAAGLVPVARAVGFLGGLDRLQLPAIEDALLTLTVENQRVLESALAQVRAQGGNAKAALFGISVLSATTAVLLALAVVRSMHGNRQLIRDLNRMAYEDGLTGLINRRRLDEVLPTEVARARRSGERLAVAMIDFDYFKRFNDERGHAAGDALLRGAARAWRAQLRPTDILARYGGEEFTLLLPSCAAGEAETLLERLRPLVPENQTFSAGVATWNGSESGERLLHRADRALLLAKCSGRNRTEVAGCGSILARGPCEGPAPVDKMEALGDLRDVASV